MRLPKQIIRYRPQRRRDIYVDQGRGCKPKPCRGEEEEESLSYSSIMVFTILHSNVTQQRVHERM